LRRQHAAFSAERVLTLLMPERLLFFPPNAIPVRPTTA
jgi:hypothetical protein